MIANARMYSVGPRSSERWKALLLAIGAHAGIAVQVIEHADPKPLEELWARQDQAAVFMCGLPFSCTQAARFPIAVPVPAPSEFLGRPYYWSEMVVRRESRFLALEDTFGERLALTVRGSQSGFSAPLTLLAALAAARGGSREPLYREVISPQISPLGALRAVIEGRAEVAPIDSYALCLLERERPELTVQVRTIACTAATAMPLLVASVEGLVGLPEAFLNAHRIASLAPVMADLALLRFEAPDLAAYEALNVTARTTERYWTAHPLAGRVDEAFFG